MFWALLLLFVPLWILSSGNIRYAIPVLMLLGPGVALLALRLGQRQHLTALLAVLLPLFGQSAPAFGLNTPNILGYQPPTWGRPWFDLKLPAPLDVQPAYYLSLQAQSFAGLTPLFPEASRFYSLQGATAAGPESFIFKRVQEAQARLGLPFRTLYEAGVHGDEEAMESSYARQDALLSEFGYQIDRADCQQIRNQEPAFRLVSCGVRRSDSMTLAERERRRAVDARFARWEQRCPRVFAASGVTSIQGLDNRGRFYPGTDFQLLEHQDGRLFAQDLFNKCRSGILLEERDGTVVSAVCPTRIPFSSNGESESGGGCAG